MPLFPIYGIGCKRLFVECEYGTACEPAVQTAFGRVDVGCVAVAPEGVLVSVAGLYDKTIEFAVGGHEWNYGIGPVVAPGVIYMRFPITVEMEGSAVSIDTEMVYVGCGLAVVDQVVTHAVGV